MYKTGGSLLGDSPPVDSIFTFTFPLYLAVKHSHFLFSSPGNPSARENSFSLPGSQPALTSGKVWKALRKQKVICPRPAKSHVQKAKCFPPSLKFGGWQNCQKPPAPYIQTLCKTSYMPCCSSQKFFTYSCMAKLMCELCLLLMCELLSISFRE